MQGLRYLFLLMSMNFATSVGFCEGKYLGKITSLEDATFIQAEERNLEEEHDFNSKLDNYLDFTKEDFLRKLNLSGPPQFMIELYNKYASIPRSDVIRSFIIQDVIYSIRQGNKTQHRLLFNVSIPNHEEITSVQLRLANILNLLDGRDFTEGRNTWEAFDMTRSWQDSGREAGELEVEIEQNRESLDVSLALEHNSSAVLIVLSDDLWNRKRESVKEVKDMLLHEKERVFLDDHVPVNQHLGRKRKATNNYCRRTSLKVNFKVIGWDKWIMAPPEYDAYECKCVCYFPLTDDITPSKQTDYHQTRQRFEHLCKQMKKTVIVMILFLKSNLCIAMTGNTGI
uniref:Growth differentiation factor 2 n=1 Tax=Sinocyclocheilus grahami TaxID=75366 RepID=A0A672LSJ0_SINGR